MAITSPTEKSRPKQSWILIPVFIAAVLYVNRHYLFTEVPKFSGVDTSDKAGRGQMNSDSIDLIAHKFVDQMRARGDTSIPESQYMSWEKELSVCLKKSTSGADTHDLSLQQFVDRFVNPCAESMLSQKSDQTDQ